MSFFLIFFLCIPGLQVSAVAKILSHNKLGGTKNGTYRKVSRCLIQLSSASMEDKALYSNSVEDLEIVYSFLEDQEIRLEPRNKKIAVVDLLSLGSLASQHH